MTLFLRALEIADVDTLYATENDTTHWKYSNRVQPYSKATLLDYIARAHEDIFAARQLRFVVASASDPFIGLVDLFDFDPLHKRCGVGLLIRKSYRNKGFGKQALDLLEDYVCKHLNLYQLYTSVAIENTPSIALFEKMGYLKTGIQKEWMFYDNHYHDVLFYQKKL